MFDFTILLMRIKNFGFVKFSNSVNISPDRLFCILDGYEFFSIKEIYTISRVLEISENEKEAYFFTPKVANEQL